SHIFTAVGNLTICRSSFICVRPHESLLRMFLVLESCKVMEEAVPRLISRILHLSDLGHWRFAKVSCGIPDRSLVGHFEPSHSAFDSKSSFPTWLNLPTGCHDDREIAASL
ncbi:hypothetical protein KC19_5G057100, partial [Ceratodon purpureus]